MIVEFSMQLCGFRVFFHEVKKTLMIFPAADCLLVGDSDIHVNQSL
jgi:hypothetical protein